MARRVRARWRRWRRSTSMPSTPCAPRRLRRSSRSSPKRPPSTTTFGATTTCWVLSPRCAIVSAARGGSPRPFRAASATSAWRGLVKGELYEYQREGALFAARAGRCLIGDEMGLGKTIQAIAAAEIMARQFGVERVLVVCPTSLKHQWEREIARFTDRKTTVDRGAARAARAALRRRRGFFAITNYDTVHRDLDLIGAVVARPGHPRRSPADQELEHAHGPQREAHRLALRHRPDGHAAREPAGGAGLHRRVRRQASAGADVQVPGRAPGARRARQGRRLSPPRPHRQDARAGADPAGQEPGADGTARNASTRTSSCR